MLRTDLSDSNSPMAQAIAWSPHQHGLLLGCDGEEDSRPNYPLVMSNIAIENGPVEIVSFPVNSMVILHSYVTVSQTVSQKKPYFRLVKYYHLPRMVRC